MLQRHKPTPGQASIGVDVELMISQVRCAAQFLSDIQKQERDLRSRLADSAKREKILESKLDETSNHATNLERELNAELGKLARTEAALRAA